VEIHIPNGINFQCTRCGNCCFSWPVPVTDEDVERIARVTGVGDSGELFRPLVSKSTRLSAYSHTLEKGADGRCQFLTTDNFCRLHAEFGPQAKPSMCQLFPYTFTPTPSGVYASVSFASTGALYNSGQPLSEQRDLIASQFQLFSQLMPHFQPDWSTAQLVDGTPLPWQDYITKIEPELLDIFAPTGTTDGASFIAGCRLASERVVRCLPKEFDPERNLTQARPKIVDQILIDSLIGFLFPGDVFACTEHDLSFQSIAVQLVKPPNKVQIRFSGGDIDIACLLDKKLSSLPPACDELLKRFLYCRIFSKLYFGAGYGNLSLLSGLHHIMTAVSLARIIFKSKGWIELGEEEQFNRLAELIRVLERRLTVASLSRESITILEVLLASPARMARILSLAA
jgi:Fe-S-cluster containining protein